MNTENKLIMIPIDKLFPHPDNPRKDVGDVTELAESIKHSGIMQNLTVVPYEGGYRVVIGHRRLAAARKAELTELPCMIADMSHKEQCATMLSENMQRVDLTPIEQAQGVQMMLDLGETVGDIAEKTGFSKSAIAKRAKIAKMPFEQLKEAENRGATLSQYIRITEIKDEKAREECLKYAGTRDFEWKIGAALRRQKAQQNMPALLAETKKIAEKFEGDNERWNGKNERIERIEAAEWKAGEALFEGYDENEKYFFWAGEDYVEIYKKRPKKKKAEPIKKSDKEIAADKARARLAKPTKTAFELRKAFLEKFNAFTPQNEKIIDEAIMLLSAHKVVSFNSSSFEFLKECVKPFKKNDGYTATILDVRAWFYDNKKKAKIQLLFTLFYDDENNGFYIRNYGENMPKYNNNYSLQFEYNILAELGYIISTEEMQLMNGTHEAFKGGETA